MISALSLAELIPSSSFRNEWVEGRCVVPWVEGRCVVPWVEGRCVVPCNAVTSPEQFTLVVLTSKNTKVSFHKLGVDKQMKRACVQGKK